MKKILSVLIICLLSACASKTTQPTSESEDRTMGGGGMGAGAQEGMRAGGGGFGMESITESFLHSFSAEYLFRL